MSDLPLYRTMQDDEIDRLKAQLKETEEKGRVLMDMCRDLRKRVTELERTGSTSTSCPFCFDQMRNSYILRKQAEAVDEVNCKLTEISEGMGGRGMDPVLVMQYAASTAGEEAQSLRKQAEAVEDIRKDLLSDLPDHPVSRQVDIRLGLRANSLREKAERAGGEN